MKKTLAFLMAMLMMLTLVPAEVLVASAESLSEVPDGYTAIRTVMDLYKVRLNLSGNYILMNDIDLTEATAKGGDFDYYGNGWNPIGSEDVYSNTAFTGIFDGNGYTISGMRMNITSLPSGTGSYLYFGLFANNNGTIKNLKVKGSIESGLSKVVYAGGIASYNSGSVYNCSSDVKITVSTTSTINVGGIAGYNSNKIYRCYNTGAIKATSSSSTIYAGGITGYDYSGNGYIYDCYNTAAIEAAYTGSSSSYYAYAGGIAGSILYSGRIDTSYNTGSIKSSNNYSSSNAKRYGIANIGSGTVNKCYYLSGTGVSCTGATSLTAAQTMIQSNFNGFNFSSVWSQNTNAIYQLPQLNDNIQDDRDVASFEINSQPSKTTFTKWDDFEVENCVVELSFTNAPSEYIEVTKDMVSGYNMNNVGTQTLTITFSRFTTTYDITVLEKEFIPVSTVEDLYAVRNDLTANYILMNDIDLTAATAEGGAYDYNGNGWNPIGSDNAYRDTGKFIGIFDGNGYTIKGLRIDVSSLPSGADTSIYLGLFANNAGTIKSLSVQGSINSDLSITTYAGGIAAYNRGTIINCSNAVELSTVRSGSYVSYAGGITGVNNGTIKQCYNVAKIHSISVYNTALAGGIAGSNSSVGEIVDCYNTGTVIAAHSNSSYNYSAHAGGIAGTSLNEIKTCYNIGEISASNLYSSSYAYKKAITFINNGVVTDCHYLANTGDNCTGATSLSAALLKEPDFLTGFDFENVWTMSGEADYPYAELQWFALGGELGIKGDAAYLSTVEPDLSNVNRIDDTFTYTWYINGAVVSENKTYTIKLSDIGKKLKCKVTGTEKYNKGELYSEEIVVTKAVQTQSAAAPSCLSVTDSSFVISTASGQEYSIDNVNWQKSGQFTNLDPNKDYTVYARLEETDLYLAGEGEATLTVTTQRRPLSGYVSISGTNRYGSALTAVVSNVGPQGATYSYSWVKNGEVIGTGSSYVITASDIGSSITLKVIGTEDYTGELASASVTGLKALSAKADAPSASEVKNNSILLVYVNGYEYSKDGTTWQDSPLFTGLSAATSYTFYQRVKETATSLAGDRSNGKAVSTSKNTVTTSKAPVVASTTGNSVTLVSVSGYEYSKDGSTWQDSPTFTGLRPCSSYTFYQRLKETATNAAGPAASISASTQKTHEYTNACDAICNICGDVRTVPAHVYDNACDATCNVCGNTRTVPAHVYSASCDASCNVCGATRTAAAHTYSNACDASCNVCGATRTPSAHVTPSSYSVVNDSYYPFTYSDGVYTSTNRSHSSTSSFTINIDSSFVLTIEYYAPTESECDEIVVRKNGSVVFTDSDTVTWKTRTISVTEGDVIRISYEKDYSASTSSDYIKFELSPKPGNAEPTCTQGVLCQVCGVTLEAALGHTYTGSCDTSCNRCGTTRTAAAAHTYSNACDTTCNVCGAIRTAAAHVYSNACDTSCNVCGATRSTSGHSYSASCDTTCNYCGYVRTTSSSHTTSRTFYTISSKSNYSLYNDMYYSTNKSNNSTASMTISIASSGTFYVTYITSTELNYDKFTVTKNSTVMRTASGESEGVVSFSVSAGDKVYIRYSKDGSSYRGQDAVYFMLPTAVITSSSTPTCEKAVICTACNSVMKSATGHSYSNACDTSCNTCGKTRTVAGHTYNNACDTTCNKCNATRTTKHTYTNNCDTICNVCNAKRTITHTYSNNCDKSCNVCGATRTVGAHKYDNACDTTCNYCNAKRTTKHTYSSKCDENCNVCNAKRSVNHTYKNVKTAATFSKNGSLAKKCSVCGKVASNTVINYVKTVTLSATSYVYNGKAKTPTVTVKDSAGKTLKKNTDYTVSYASGRKGVGTYKVTIKLKGNYNGSKTVTFTIKPTTKTSASLFIGDTFTIGAKSNKSISYSSSNKNIAKVSSKGVITGVKAGKATITVKSNGVSQKITVTVKSPTVKVTAGASKIMVGKTTTFKASVNPSGGTVKWSSSNTSVAKVSSKGVVTGVKGGSANITASYTYKGKTYKASAKITVKTPTISLNTTSASIGRYDSLSLKATTNPSGLSVSWSSSNTSIARVSGSGYVTPVKAGSCKITASFKYAGKTYKATCSLTVVNQNPVEVTDVDWETNSAGGVEPSITIKNNTNKDIKYIVLETAYKNRFGDPAYCEIRDDYRRNLRVSSGLSAKSTRTFYWDPAIYNYNVHRVDIDHITVTFVDGTEVEYDYTWYWYDSYYYYR